jgi:DNA-binding LytR/AlgR family response regulator
VFVTAYDQYALQAFEAQAVDYVLKPVQPARLRKTVAKLQALLAQRQGGATSWRPRWAIAQPAAASARAGCAASRC